LQPSLFARLLAADQHGSGTVDNAGRIAGMVHVVDRLELGMCLYRDRIKPTHLASCTKEGLSCAKDCMVVLCRMCSSLARMVSPFASLTEIAERAKRPSFHAVAARLWLSTA